MKKKKKKKPTLNVMLSGECLMAASTRTPNNNGNNNNNNINMMMIQVYVHEKPHSRVSSLHHCNFKQLFTHDHMGNIKVYPIVLRYVNQYEYCLFAECNGLCLS